MPPKQAQHDLLLEGFFSAGGGGTSSATGSSPAITSPSGGFSSSSFFFLEKQAQNPPLFFFSFLGSAATSYPSGLALKSVLPSDPAPEAFSASSPLSPFPSLPGNSIMVLSVTEGSSIAD